MPRLIDLIPVPTVLYYIVSLLVHVHVPVDLRVAHRSTCTYYMYNVYLAASKPGADRQSGGCGKSKIYGDYMGTIFILKTLDLVHTSEYT